MASKDMTFGAISDLDRLLEDLEALPDRLVKNQIPAVREARDRLRKEWRSNARKTAPPHGKLYPRAITADRVTVHGLRLETEVGPDADKPQGGMSFELGSKNQPPHLDGMTAARNEEDRFAKGVEDAIGDLL